MTSMRQRVMRILVLSALLGGGYFACQYAWNVLGLALAHRMTDQTRRSPAIATSPDLWGLRHTMRATMLAEPEDYESFVRRAGAGLLAGLGTERDRSNGNVSEEKSLLFLRSSAVFGLAAAVALSVWPLWRQTQDAPAHPLQRTARAGVWLAVGVVAAGTLTVYASMPRDGWGAQPFWLEEHRTALLLRTTMLFLIAYAACCIYTARLARGGRRCAGCEYLMGSVSTCSECGLDKQDAQALRAVAGHRLRRFGLGLITSFACLLVLAFTLRAFNINGGFDRAGRWLLLQPTEHLA